MPGHGELLSGYWAIPYVVSAAMANGSNPKLCVKSNLYSNYRFEMFAYAADILLFCFIAILLNSRYIAFSISLSFSTVKILCIFI